MHKRKPIERNILRIIQYSKDHPNPIQQDKKYRIKEKFKLSSLPDLGPLGLLAKINIASLKIKHPC